MKMTYAISQKFKITLSLAIMIIILLMTNILSKRHFGELQSSFSSVYEDRLLVEVHIYKITTFLNEKNMLLHESFENNEMLKKSKFSALNDSINFQIHGYEKTVFTTKEVEVFEKLKGNLERLSALEDSVISQSKPTNDFSFLLQTNQYQARLSSNLSQLSNIQRMEGQRLMDQTNQLVSSSKLTLQLELVILIVIALIVQALIFSSKSTMPKMDQNSRLN